MSRVSIIIPVYNGANYLAQAIDSALAQTYQDLEIIVVNDGSNDGGATQQIIRSYGERIRAFEKPNGGVSTALNLGLDVMTGAYFSWLSHDDLYRPDKVRRQVEHLASFSGRDVISYCDFDAIDAEGRVLQTCRAGATTAAQFPIKLLMTNFLHGCTLMIPRAAFERCGRFDPGLRAVQDYDLWFRMAHEYDFESLPEVLVQGRYHPEQDSHRISNTAAREGSWLYSSLLARPPGAYERRMVQAAGYTSLTEFYCAAAENLEGRWYSNAASIGLRQAAYFAMRERDVSQVRAATRAWRSVLELRYRRRLRQAAKRTLRTLGLMTEH